MSEELNGGAFQQPVGYRFDPTKEELLNYYLNRRVRGDVDNPCIIPDVYICRCHPWELLEVFYGKSVLPPDDQLLKWWFFSPYAPDTAGKVKRSTPCGCGYWKKTGDDKEVTAKDDEVIGYKKILVFHDKRQDKNGVKTNWVIHEYHLPDNHPNRTHVLCRLKLKRDKREGNSRERSNLRAIMRRLLESKLRPGG